MPRYKFSWEAFDRQFLEALAEFYGLDTEVSKVDEKTLAGYLSETKKRPDLEFIRESRWVIHEHFLADYPGLIEMARRLQERGIGPGTRIKSSQDALNYLEGCKNCHSLRLELWDALIDTGNKDLR